MEVIRFGAMNSIDGTEDSIKTLSPDVYLEGFPREKLVIMAT